MKFHITVFDDSPKVSQPIGNGVLRNDGHDFDEAAQGILTIDGYSLEASLKLVEIEVPFENPRQVKMDLAESELYDEKL